MASLWQIHGAQQDSCKGVLSCRESGDVVRENLSDPRNFLVRTTALGFVTRLLSNIWRAIRCATMNLKEVSKRKFGSLSWKPLNFYTLPHKRNIGNQLIECQVQVSVLSPLWYRNEGATLIWKLSENQSSSLFSSLITVYLRWTTAKVLQLWVTSFRTFPLRYRNKRVTLLAHYDGKVERPQLKDLTDQQSSILHRLLNDSCKTIRPDCVGVIDPKLPSCVPGVIFNWTLRNNF